MQPERSLSPSSWTVKMESCWKVWRWKLISAPGVQPDPYNFNFRPIDQGPVRPRPNAGPVVRTDDAVGMSFPLLIAFIDLMWIITDAIKNTITCCTRRQEQYTRLMLQRSRISELQSYFPPARWRRSIKVILRYFLPSQRHFLLRRRFFMNSFYL